MSSDAFDRREPWVTVHLTALALVHAAAVVVLAGAWIAVSGASRTSHQLGWLGLAAASVGAAAFGDALWLLVGRNAAVRQRMLTAEVVLGPQEEEPVVHDRLVVGTGMTRYHKSSCLLVNNKAVRTVSMRSAKRRRLRPCDICAPEVEL